jgi:ornithine cyclodeaminase/alanine dehydrogenase-like protein (mu-crystallin family)
MEFLDEEKVRSLLTWEALIPAVEQALIHLSLGKTQQPVRTILRIAEHEGFFALMPAIEGELMGVKLVTFYERNVSLPTHQAVIQLLSAKTGEPLIAMDGRLITEMRTAAVSAIATRLFAPRNSRTLAILGSGVQARSHLRALRLVRDFSEVRVWSRAPEHARTFASEFGVTAVETPEAAVRGADVVVIAASSHTPILFDDWVAPGTHVVSVGATRPAQREMDPALVARARLFVDSRAAALAESGDVIPFGATHIVAELGEAGAARKSPDEITIFKSLGLAVEDVVSAHLVLTRATESGRGLVI